MQKINHRYVRLSYYYLSIVLIFCTLLTCQKEKYAERPYPKIKTLDVSNINSSGAVFEAEIISGNIGNITECGFVWDQQDVSGIEHQQPVPGKIKNNKFTAEVHSAMEKGRKYFVLAYVRTADYLVYGKSVSFTSLGSESPVIRDFNPKKGTWGDTIRISGKNFGLKKEGVNVGMGDLSVPVVSVSDSSIVIKVPDTINSDSVKINVSLAGQTVTSKDPFLYIIPEFSGITPEYITYRDTIYITGSNLISNKYPTNLCFNEANMTLSYASERLLKVVVPDNYTKETTNIKIFGPTGFVNWKGSLHLIKPSVKSFSPDTVLRPSGIITIEGDHFHPVLKNNKILIGGFPATNLEGSTHQLKVQLPDQIIPNYDISVKSSAEIALNVGEFNVKMDKALAINWRSTWTRKRDFPGATRSYGVGFSIGEKGYVGLGSNQFEKKYFRDLWEYDPNSDSWQQKADYPGRVATYQTGIAFNGSGYVGLGNMTDTTGVNFKDFYKYDPIGNNWTKLADYGGSGRGLALSFVSEGNIYIGGGQRFPSLSEGPPYWAVFLNDNWKYNPQSNSWSQELNIPEITNRDVILTVNNEIYKFGIGKIWQFSGTSWNDKGRSEFIGDTDGNISFSIGSRGYIYRDARFSYYNLSIFEFDPSSGKTSLFKIPDDILKRNPSIFAIGKKAYIICGNNYQASKTVWEFDPSLPLKN